MKWCKIVLINRPILLAKQIVADLLCCFACANTQAARLARSAIVVTSNFISWLLLKENHLYYR